MDEYIERETALMRLMQDGCSAKNVQTIMEIPAADVEPVRHGRWEWDTEDLYRCTVCYEKVHVKEVMGRPDWDYCPNCGARMTEDIDQQKK